jgi:hypothetical protein
MTLAKPPTRREVQVAVGLSATLLFSIILLTAALNGARRSDFTTLYTGALLIARGNASSLYDLGGQSRIQRQLFNRKDLLPYVHPPFQALLLAPLAGLSPDKGYILVGVINVLLWVFFQHLLRRYSPVPMNPYRYILLCSLFPPLWVALLQGQSTVLLLMLFSLTYVCLRRGQEFRAGVFLGLGLYKFPIVLPFALICLLSGKWRLIAGFAAVGSLLGMLSLVAVGPSGVWAYAKLLIDILGNPDKPAYWSMRLCEWMPTARGFFSVLLAGELSAVYIKALAGAVSIALVFLVALRWRLEGRAPGEGSLGLMFAAALVISQVTAPHLYLHDLTLMLLPVLLVIGSSQWSGKSAQRAIIVGATVTLYAPPVYVLLLRWKAMYALAPLFVAFALAAISLAKRADLPLVQTPLPVFSASGDEVS